MKRLVPCSETTELKTHIEIRSPAVYIIVQNEKNDLSVALRDAGYRLVAFKCDKPTERHEYWAITATEKMSNEVA